jgi:hypothetical protein
VKHLEPLLRVGHEAPHALVAHERALGSGPQGLEHDLRVDRLEFQSAGVDRVCAAAEGVHDLLGHCREVFQPSILTYLN